MFSFAFFGIAILMLAAGIAILLEDQRSVGLALYSLLFAAFGLAHWYGAKGARDGKDYGRVLSRVFGMLWLLGFPVTTILGVYVLLQTGTNWKQSSSPSSNPA